MIFFFIVSFSGSRESVVVDYWLLASNRREKKVFHLKGFQLNRNDQKRKIDGKNFPVYKKFAFIWDCEEWKFQPRVCLHLFDLSSRVLIKSGWIFRILLANKTQSSVCFHLKPVELRTFSSWNISSKITSNIDRSRPPKSSSFPPQKTSPSSATDFFLSFTEMSITKLSNLYASTFSTFSFN